MTVHAWRAWRLELAQHVTVVAIFVIAWLWAWPCALIAGGTLAILYVGRRLLSLAGDFVSYYRGGKSSREFEQLRRRRVVLGYGMLVACVACVVAIVIALRHIPAGLHGPWFARSGLAGAALVLILVAGVLAVISAIRQVRLGRLHDDHGGKARSAGRRLSTISAQQEHPFTVYSGFTPFIGSGREIYTWSFAQRLIHRKSAGDLGAQEYDTPPFTAEELVGYLKEKVGSLSEEPNPETRLAGLAIADHVLVEGTHAYPYLPALNARPGSPEVEDAITELIASSSDAARHYLAFRVESWGGEVVTTIFVHLSLQGRTLYLEFSAYALLPTRNEYHIIDEVGETGPAAAMRAAAKSAAKLTDVLVAPWRLMQAPRDLWAAVRARTDGTATARRGLNIGATVSAREAAIEVTGESYFQFRDIIQHSKIIERRLIASVGEFLKDHDVDTSEFQQRTDTILNNSVTISAGGAVVITGSAIGNQASAGDGSAPPSDAGA